MKVEHSLQMQKISQKAKKYLPLLACADQIDFHRSLVFADALKTLFTEHDSFIQIVG